MDFTLDHTTTCDRCGWTTHHATIDDSYVVDDSATATGALCPECATDDDPHQKSFLGAAALQCQQRKERLANGQFLLGAARQFPLLPSAAQTPCRGHNETERLFPKR